MGRMKGHTKGASKSTPKAAVFPCTKCLLAVPFSTRSQLATHTRDMHQDDLKISLTTGGTVVVHRDLDQTSATYRMMLCPFADCGKVYSKADSMRAHYLRSHLPSGKPVSAEPFYAPPLPPQAFRAISDTAYRSQEPLDCDTSFEEGDTSFDPETTLVDADGGDVEMAGTIKDFPVTSAVAQLSLHEQTHARLAKHGLLYIGTPPSNSIHALTCSRGVPYRGLQDLPTRTPSEYATPIPTRPLSL
jgi:hypothetical protein